MNNRKRMIRKVKKMLDNSAIVVKVSYRNKRTYTMDNLKEAFKDFKLEKVHL